MTVGHAWGLALATIRMDGCWSGELQRQNWEQRGEP